MYVVKDTKVPNPNSSGHAKGSSSKAQSKPKKKREVLSADAQNRKIAELEAKLGNYHDSKSMGPVRCLADRQKNLKRRVIVKMRVMMKFPAMTRIKLVLWEMDGFGFIPLGVGHSL
jgi:hypothetical protein